MMTKTNKNSYSLTYSEPAGNILVVIIKLLAGYISISDHKMLKTKEVSFYG